MCVNIWIYLIITIKRSRLKIDTLCVLSWRKMKLEEIKMDWANVLIILIVVLMIFGSAKNDVNKNRK